MQYTRGFLCRITLMVSLILALLFSSAIAEVMPRRADLIFDSATANLKTNKYVKFSCGTYDVMKSISVTECVLEQKVSGKWEEIKELDLPPSSANTFGYTKLIETQLKNALPQTKFVFD